MTESEPRGVDVFLTANDLNRLILGLKACGMRMDRFGHFDGHWYHDMHFEHLLHDQLVQIRQRLQCE